MVEQLQTGEIDITRIARNEQVNDSWISPMVRLNFLAPSIVDAILAGTARQRQRGITAQCRSADRLERAADAIRNASAPLHFNN